MQIVQFLRTKTCKKFQLRESRCQGSTVLSHLISLPVVIPFPASFFFLCFFPRSRTLGLVATVFPFLEKKTWLSQTNPRDILSPWQTLPICKFGLDQLVASISRHVSLGVGVKKDKNPQSCDGRIVPWWYALVLLGVTNWSTASVGMILAVLALRLQKTTWTHHSCDGNLSVRQLTDNENPNRSKKVDCSDCSVVTPCWLGVNWAPQGEAMAQAFLLFPSPMGWFEVEGGKTMAFGWWPPNQWVRFVFESGRMMALSSWPPAWCGCNLPHWVVCVCVCVLLCFVDPILGNRYGPGVNSFRQ